ncbi:MAG: hypothetical protein U0234_28610 [Sandaracinus sp.]
MKKIGTMLVAMALVGLAGTALAQALPALTAGAPASAGQIAADPSLTLTIDTPQEVIIDAIAQGGMDAQLRLMHDGSYVADDSDSGDGTNARLAAFLAPGTYQIITYEYQYRPMTATVQVTQAPAFTPVATIAPGAAPAAISTPEGDWSRASSVEVALNVASPGNYTITAATSDEHCSPEIQVIRNMEVEGYTISNSGSGTPATAERALVAGNYTLRIRNWWGHSCPMTVSVAPAS